MEGSVRNRPWSGVENQIHRVHAIPVPCISLPTSDQAKKGGSYIGKQAISVLHIHDDWLLVGKVAEMLEEHLDV